MLLPWSNVTVTTDQQAISRGIQMSMGTPPQIVALRPSTADGDLYVVNKAQCAPDYNDSCIGLYGGVFDYAASSTFLQVSQAQWNGTTEPNPNQLSFVHFNDLLTLGNASILGFPSIYDEPGYGGQGVLPLGSNSDLLRIAVDSGAVPSTVFGLWTGSRSIDNPVDGSLVIGGYDTARIKGDLTTFPSREKCEMCVVITGLTYDDDSGSTNLFSSSEETLQVSLQPGENVLYAPQNIWENFQTATDGIYSEGVLIYPTSNPPTGSLTVTLEDGFKTTIPAEELFFLPRYYNGQGQYVVGANTYLVGNIYNSSNTDYVMDWGIPYLTMNYVIGDYQRSQFKMATAVRTAAQGGGYKLQASCDPTAGSTPSATASSGATTDPVASSSAVPAQHGSGKSNTGAIIGGAVGGALGLILIVGGLALMFYRTRRRRNASNTYAAPAMAGGEGGMSHYTGTGSVADRQSQWTSMSPTEIPSELGDNQKPGGNVQVNHWLSSQSSDVSFSFLAIVVQIH